MNFAPHTLQVKVISKPQEDEFGRPIPGTGGEHWETICECRCDDNDTTKQVSVNGQVHDYSYLVVYEGEKIEAGTEVRAIDGEEVRGEGSVIRSTKCNNLAYAKLWM